MLRKVLCSTMLAVIAATAACRPGAEDYETTLARGERLVEGQAWDEALELFDRLQRRFPDRDEPLTRLVEISDRLGRPEAVIAALEERVAAGDAEAAYGFREMLASRLAQLERHQEAKPHYREMLRLRPENGALYFELSQLEARTGAYDEAVAVAAEGVRRAPSDPRLRSWYGEALMKRGRWDEAEEILRETFELEDAGAYPHYVLGLIYLHRDRLDEARRELETATALQPTSQQSWYQLANVCERAGDLEARDRALQEFARLYRQQLGSGS